MTLEVDLMVIFMTGSTGFIGKETLRQWAGREDTLLLLVRTPGKAQRMLQEIGLSGRKDIHLLQGDLSAPGLGLSADDTALAMTADVIVHSGGTMDITLGSDAARRVFLEGARHLAELAERIHRSKGLRHMIHVVGYMSPFHDGNVDPEADVMRMDRFMEGEGAYERMKFLADLYIRQQSLKHGYPLSVVNPSTIVGAKPAGVTEQTGGLGILVHAVRHRLMPLVPGGPDYWVPLVANDVVARAIVRLACDEAPNGGTYNMLGDKEASPNMNELLGAIARELRMPIPRLSAPVGLLRTVMGTGLGRMTGIPAESLAFITNRSFRTEESKRLLQQMGQENDFDVRDVLPFVIADLDYRLSVPGYADPARFSRRRAGRLAALMREGTGTPWLLVHGLLGGADDFAPLADRLHELTGAPVWLLDLPGFGRSPSPVADGGLDGHAAAVYEAAAALGGRVQLVGHSLGAAVAARAAALLQDGLERLILLQPVLHRPRGGVQRALSASPATARLLLRRMTPRAVAAAMRRNGSFAADGSDMPPGYADAVARRLSSPRIAAANAAMLRALHHQPLTLVASDLSRYGDRAAILWGERDLAYSMPESFERLVRVTRIPYGHQFPISHPLETAESIVRLTEQR